MHQIFLCPIFNYSLLQIYEISNIQDCPRGDCTVGTVVQGTDHGKGKFVSGPVYGQYALYVSSYDHSSPRRSLFPPPGCTLKTIVGDEYFGLDITGKEHFIDFDRGPVFVGNFCSSVVMLF